MYVSVQGSTGARARRSGRAKSSTGCRADQRRYPLLVLSGLLTVILIGLAVENLVFRKAEQRTVRHAGLNRHIPPALACN